MNSEIYLCYKRTLTSIVAASLVFERLRNNGYSVFYSRKLRENDFIKHISEIIAPVKDVIVLLDERSFMALNEGDEKFLGSWFGKELLEGFNQNKNIIVICLNGYKLPEKTNLPKEVHFLYDGQILELDTFELNDTNDMKAIIENLSSKPTYKYFEENRVSYENTSDFLIYSNGDCNIYEYGYLIATLDSNVDKHHPFKYSVNRSGEHNFYIINNDTGQIKEMTFDINPGHQKYMFIEWSPARNVISLTEEDIRLETDCEQLYTWGKSFFYTNPKRIPDYHRAFLCFSRAAELHHQKAIDFIRKYDHSLSSIFKVPQDVTEQWYKKAAEYGSPEAWMKIGESHETANNYADAIICYERAKQLGHTDAEYALDRCTQKNNIPPVSQKDKFLCDFHTIVQNFDRLVGSVCVDRFNRKVRFDLIAVNLRKVETMFNNPANRSILNHYDSDLGNFKYHNRIYELLGFLSSKGIFENLSHKDILEICLDEKGENQSKVKELRAHISGATISYSQIAKQFNRMNEAFKRELIKALNAC